MSRWRFRILALVGVSVAALLALVVANIARRGAGKGVRIDAATAKPDDAYKQAQAKGAAWEPMPPDFFDNVSIVTNDTEISVSWPMGDFGQRSFPAELALMGADGALQLAEGVLRLVAMGSALASLVPQSEWQNYYPRTAPGQYFTHDGKPLSTNEVKALMPGVELGEFRTYQAFPNFKLWFSTTNLPVMKALRVSGFDARTKQPIVSHWSSEVSNGTLVVGMEPTMWHPGPVRLLVDLALGPTVDHMLSNRKAARVDLPLGGIKIVDRQTLPPGRDIQGWNSGATGGKLSIRMNVRQTSSEHAKALRTLFVLGIHPQSFNNPFDYEAIDNDGKIIETRTHGSSWNLNFVSVAAEPERIKGFRIKFYPKAYRVFVDLPEIPGLPEFNRGVENLLDVKVPFALFNQQWDREDFIRKTLQVDLPYFGVAASAEKWPMAFTNVSVREILAVYSTNLPPPHRMEYDPWANQLLVNRGGMHRLMRNLRFLFP
jgi:hypothetical protein